MHSHPARVVNAYWNGAVACSIAGPNCCAMVRATNRLMMSPATMPLTPPVGFCSAVILPVRTACKISSGTSRAKLWYMLQNRSARHVKTQEQVASVLLSSLNALHPLHFWHSSTTERGSSANWTLAEN